MKDKLVTIAACLIFLAGAAIFCYPFAMNWYYGYHTSHVLDSYKNEIKELSKQTAEKVQKMPETTDQAPESQDMLDKLYEEMALYNQTIYENRQKDLTDPFSYESASFDLTAYGLSDNIIGYLTIPAMDVELPIYLGANSENMTKGAVHLGQTSMPIGGINTNVVLAAHRGYQGIPMFREIEKLKVRDPVTITTPWDTLTYQVTKTEIILPDEINKILIQPDKDMLTLFTCHPYRENSHRYVVYCERTFPTTESAKTETAKEPSPKPHSDLQSQEAPNSESSAYSSSRHQILIDKYVPIAGIVFLVILFLVCMLSLRKK